MARGTARWRFLSRARRPTATQGCRVRLCDQGRWLPGPRLEDALPAGYVQRRGQGVRSDAGEAVAQAEDEGEDLPDSNVLFSR